MIRLAAHYIIAPNGDSFKMHYLEFDETNHLLAGIYPLNQEIEHTSFYSGTLIIVQPCSENPGVEVYHSERTDFSPAKLSASDSRSNSDVKRLC